MRTIVWDVDDVLNDLMRSWFKYGLAKSCRRKSGLKYDGLTQNHPHLLLGMTKREYLRSLDVFRNSPKGAAMRPNPDVLNWFRSYGKLARHVALTSRPLHTVPGLAEWVFRHFGEWIRTFAFVPTRSEKAIPFYDKDKHEYLKWLGKADMLIDDSPENIQNANSLRVKTLLYPRPWNKSRLTVSQLLGLLTKYVKNS
jgi:5'(3')-deoxyribonucleotidase